MGGKHCSQRCHPPSERQQQQQQRCGCGQAAGGSCCKPSSPNGRELTSIRDVLHHHDGLLLSAGGTEDAPEPGKELLATAFSPCEEFRMKFFGRAG